MDPRHEWKFLLWKQEVDRSGSGVDGSVLAPPLTHHHMNLEVHALHLLSFHDPCSTRLDLDRHSHLFQFCPFLTYLLTWQPNFRAASSHCRS